MRGDQADAQQGAGAAPVRDHALDRAAERVDRRLGADVVDDVEQGVDRVLADEPEDRHEHDQRREERPAPRSTSAPPPSR